jgi:Uma2 family endonuclease
MNKPANIDLRLAQPYNERLFTSDDFARMIECGAFEDMRVELVGGVLERMSPAYGDHGSTNGDLYSQLLKTYRDAPVWLAIDLATKIDDFEVRGPDIAVVQEDAPKDALVEVRFVILIVEIAKSTLGRDLGQKAFSYSRSGVPEYWVVDLPGRVTHVFTEPGVNGYAERNDVPFGVDIQPPGANGSIRIN